MPYAWLIFQHLRGPQRRLVLRQGTYLAHRRATATSTVFKGLFVEVRYDAVLDLIRLARSFPDTALLAECLPPLPH